ncbi:MAG: DsrE family protein [Algoriphagus sp.]|uniref:DsrE family protein n=1 Tax=Algoriphagus sp. TaxID=1872435 RepID=UPI001853AC3E|nr:DsrE family protein [Algoriphagus sp.]NVJ86916.1 DsrE family protein [Algoriphagus sp.]
MKKIGLACLVIFLGFSLKAIAQEEVPPHIKDHITYPVLDFHPFVGVMPIQDPALMYDSTLDYKVVLDLYGRIRDTTAIHQTFLEVARTYNLGIATGVPAEKLHIAAVIHGGLVQAILNDQEYQEKYGKPNPNLEAIKLLHEVGVKFYVCGQSMGFLNVKEEDISPLIHPAISAKYSFVSLDQQGYTYLNISN